MLIARLERLDAEIEAHWRGGSVPRSGRGPRSKYTSDDIDRVAKLTEEGMTVRAISALTGIPNQTVSDLLKRVQKNKSPSQSS